MLPAGPRGILTRLGQLRFAGREAGWDRNRQGAALSQLANDSTCVGYFGVVGAVSRDQAIPPSQRSQDN